MVRLLRLDTHQLLVTTTLGKALEVTAYGAAHIVELTLLVHGRPIPGRRLESCYPLAPRAERGGPDDRVAAVEQPVRPHGGGTHVTEARAQDVGAVRR
jgi:hypothetical protein